jgi:hypothetical protein
LKGAVVAFGLGAVALAGLVWWVRRRAGAVNAAAGATPVPDDTPDGPASGKITDFTRNAFAGFTFATAITNPSTRTRTFTVALDFVPAGGLQFGVDPFHRQELITIPARSTVGVDFIDDDLSFAPIGSGKATLSIDGLVVDQK